MPRAPSISPTMDLQRRSSTASDHPRSFVFVAGLGNQSRVSGSSSAGPLGDPNGVAKVVETLNRKQPPSCDACRTRKLKCSGRPVVIELGPEAIASVPCDHCREWSLDCSYLYQRKRRGRKNRVVERLAEEQRARKQGGEAGELRARIEASPSDSEDEVPDRVRGESFASRPDTGGTRRESFLGYMGGASVQAQNQAIDARRDMAGRSATSGTATMDTAHHERGGSSRGHMAAQPVPPLPSPSLPVLPHYRPSTNASSSRDFYTSPPDAYQLPPPTVSNTDSRSYSYPGPSQITSAYQPTHLPLPADRTHDYALQSVNNAPFMQPSVSGTATSTSPNNEVSPGIALSEASVPPTTSIAAILPRDLAMLTVRLYFDHVYCIIPVIHRPSFMADLTTREEERRPMFFALVMAMIATTLIHVPKSFFPIPAESVRRLSDKCLKACLAVTSREMDNPTVDLVCIKYFVLVIHNKHGNTGLEAAAFGEAQYLAISLGLHREENYQDLNPIESERRRRVWFLLHNADKFEALSRSKPVLLRSDEFMGPESTTFPAELDDKSITSHGYLPSSIPVPLITGFNILTRIGVIMGDIMIHERDIRRRPPSDPEGILSALKEVRVLQQRVKQIVERLPRPFQLEVGSGNLLPAPGWEEAIRDELDLFFSDPMSSETAKDGYLVLKANIHVTLAMTRLRIILHREDLLNRSGLPGTPSRNAAELVAADLGEQSDWRQGVYQDLFKAVHGLPIQALAANGPSLVTKIRVVAVSLLDALPAQDQVDPDVQGIAAYLLDFLNIMTLIESQFAD
ncbi:hypothetical protein IAU60_002891 [Kwoniella sp. DSM 27419]